MSSKSGLRVSCSQRDGSTHVIVGNLPGVGMGYDPEGICAAVRYVLHGKFKLMGVDGDFSLGRKECRVVVTIEKRGHEVGGAGSGDFATATAAAVVDALLNYKREFVARESGPKGANCEDLCELTDPYRSGWITLDARSGRFYATNWRGHKVELRRYRGHLRLQVVGKPLYFEAEGLNTLLETLNILKEHREAISLRGAATPESLVAG